MLYSINCIGLCVYINMNVGVPTASDMTHILSNNVRNYLKKQINNKIIN